MFSSVACRGFENIRICSALLDPLLPATLLIALRVRLAPERQPQLQHPLPMPLLIQVSHPGQKQIVQRNHSNQLSTPVIHDRHPRETRLSHAEDHHAQGLIRMRDHRLSEYIGQQLLQPVIR